MKRKDFKTKSGHIFNLPADYELDESKGYLGGIIEIPFDVFSKDSGKNIQEKYGKSNQKGGRRKIKTNKITPMIALQELFTQSLGGRYPPGGRPNNQQRQLRQEITGKILEEIRDEFLINISIILRLSQSGLYVNFYRSENDRDQDTQFADFQNFHLTIHDQFFNNPPTHYGSMAHTEGENLSVTNIPHYSDNVIDVRRLLKLHTESGSPLFKFRLNLIDEPMTQTNEDRMIIKTVNTLNELLFIGKIRVDSIVSRYGRETRKSYLTLTLPLNTLGGRKNKYKKTKRKSKKQKRKTYKKRST